MEVDVNVPGEMGVGISLLVHFPNFAARDGWVVGMREFNDVHFCYTLRHVTITCFFPRSLVVVSFFHIQAKRKLFSLLFSTTSNQR